MSRPSEYGTKTLSVRVSTQDYVNVIQIAEKKKLSTAEYIIYKLFKADDSDNLQKTIDTLQKEQNELIEQIKSEKSKFSDLSAKYSDLSAKYSDLVTRWNKQQEEIRKKQVVPPIVPPKK